MGALRDQIPQVVMMGIAGPTPTQEEWGLIEQGVGGVILFERNCLYPAQIAELIAALQKTAITQGPGIPLIIAIDQTRGAPEWILTRHSTDEFANLGIDRWPTDLARS